MTSPCKLPCYFARPVSPCATVGIAMIAFRALGVLWLLKSRYDRRSRDAFNRKAI